MICHIGYFPKLHHVCKVIFLFRVQVNFFPTLLLIMFYGNKIICKSIMYFVYNFIPTQYRDKGIIYKLLRNCLELLEGTETRHSEVSPSDYLHVFQGSPSVFKVFKV